MTKGVDIRLKEIKLMIAIKEEEEEEKKKLKEKVKRKERDTRVTQVKEREKVVKDRKKIRDSDAPELMEAERKYFEIVEKVSSSSIPFSNFSSKKF